VRADGTTFAIGERRVRLLGVNASIVHGESTRDDAPRLMHAMMRDGVQVARIWALGEHDGDEPWAEHVAFRTGRDEWVDASYAHLDAVVAEAKKRNVRLIVVLANRWADRGGLPQYARWAGIPLRRRNLLPSELAHVLRSEDVRAQYRAHLERVVPRHADDPTILSWEIANELSTHSCATQEALVDFVDAMSSHLRALDPNHLVAAGHIGFNSERSRRFWSEVHELPEIGYADTHGYPQNLLDATTPERFGAWLDERVAAADRLLKPLLVGEVGIPREDAFDRLAWFQSFFARAEIDGADGVLLWMYRPWQERESQHGIWPWGPFAEETAPLRELLRETSKRWARDPHPTGDPDGPFRTAASEASFRKARNALGEPQVDSLRQGGGWNDPLESGRFPLGIERVRPWVDGEWVDDALEIDPWVLAEGCDGWARYVIPWSPTERIALEVVGASEGTFEVLLDTVPVGTWRDGTFTPTGALPPSDEGTAWLWLDARDSAGHALLTRFTRELPGALRVVLRRSSDSG